MMKWIDGKMEYNEMDRWVDGQMGRWIDEWIEI